ncbi:MAG: LpqB family beta-propeller domain-containing protein [Nocardioides sp.]
MRRRVRTGLAGLLGCLAVATTGCVGIPQDGPIVDAETAVGTSEELGLYNDPPSPTPGAPPTDIVKGFLDAQTAIPLQTNTAKEFLTTEEAATWRPSQRTITYAGASFPEGSNRVSVELDGANQIDPRGSWLGPLPPEKRELGFTMARQDGEWRIDEAPDALVVPETWFSQAYRRVSLYYLDPTAEILVPEPVFVPRGDQLGSSLVDALLRGPFRRLADVQRSAIPPGLELDLSVSLTRDGIGEVNLIGGVSMPTEGDAALMVAQIARTLAQDTAYVGFRVNLDGEPVTLAGGLSEFPMDQGDALDPAAPQATSLLFGLRDGRLVSGGPGDLVPVTGPMGAEDQGLRSVGVGLTGASVAGVSAAGSEVLLTEVRTSDADVTEILSGATDLLQPAWDHAGRLWLLNRTRTGARISVYDDETGLREVRFRGMTGETISRFLVSRDGSRLVAILDGPSGDRVLISRIRYDARGRALSGTPAREIAWDGQTRLRVSDIGWSSPISIVIAHRLSGDLHQVRSMSVDGAPAGVTSLAATVQERPWSLVSSPRTTDPVYVVTRSGVLDMLSASRAAPPDPELTFLTYVGG